MQLNEILIFLGIIVLFSYSFDALSSKTKVPSVVLLLGLGVGLKLSASIAGFNTVKYENLVQELLPLLGTLGLIFIVLEGALELQITREKRPMIIQSLWAALVILVVTALGLVVVFSYLGFDDLQSNLLHALPLSVISSAIAIPSVQGFAKHQKEFIVYETSFSDILGVLFFNFVSMHAILDWQAFASLGGELLLIIVLSIASTVLLGYLFEKLGPRKKFIFVLAVLVLVYGIAKSFHLSALVLIFIFGTFAGNSRFFLGEVLRTKVSLPVLETELHGFQSFVTEMAFVLRTFFFVVFGFSIKFSGLMHLPHLLHALSIVSLIFLIRYLYYYFTKIDKGGKMWLIAPRGLITVLLYYSIPTENKISLINQDVMLWVILLSILILSFGGLLSKNSKSQEV